MNNESRYLKPRVSSKPLLRCPFEAFRFVRHVKYGRGTGLFVQHCARVLIGFALPRPKQILSGSAVVSRNFNRAMTRAATAPGTDLGSTRSTITP